MLCNETNYTLAVSVDACLGVKDEPPSASRQMRGLDVRTQRRANMRKLSIRRPQAECRIGAGQLRYFDQSRTNQ